MAKLYFYYSAMNAGKTTVLLQSAFNYRERGMNTLLFAPAIDDRYRIGLIKSRIGLESEAITFDNHFRFDMYFKDRAHEREESISCILLDEAHFLSKEQVWQLAYIVDFLNVPVITYGLRTDFLGRPFEGSQHLLAIADKIVELKTICHCGRKATMVVRINEKGQAVTTGEQVEIGGNSRYISMCRRHYVEEIERSQNS